MKYIKTYENLTDNNYNVGDYVFLLKPEIVAQHLQNLVLTQPAEIIKKENVKILQNPSPRYLGAIAVLDRIYKVGVKYLLLYPKGWAKSLIIYNEDLETESDYFRKATSEEVEKYKTEILEYETKTKIRKSAKKYNL